MKVHLSGPWITKREIDYVTDAVTNSWYENAGTYNKRFETAFADYLDVKYVMALPSCTSAIHLALLALNIGKNGKNDEVIVPDITWIGSSAPITYVGANPVFADIDEKTWCLSFESFENLITKNTKAVIPVDLYGNIPYDIDKIIDIAQDNNITVIEDAAEAIGSYKKVDNKEADNKEVDYKKAGSFGDIGVFSFHGSKILTTGEGGLLVTNNKNIYERCLFLRNHGRSTEDSKMFINTEVAYKYKMSDLQAALGLAQLERIDELVNRKQDIFKIYKKELEDLIKDNVLIMNYESRWVKSSYWMVTIILNSDLGTGKEKVIDMMKYKDIDCRPFFYPLSSLPAYSGLKNVDNFQQNNIISYRISPYGINLPSGMDMDEEKIKYVCNNLRDILL